MKRALAVWICLLASLAAAAGAHGEGAPRAEGPAKALPVAIRNAGFEEPTVHDEAPGWITGQHAGQISYRFTVDDKERHAGRKSLRIDSIGPEPFGAVLQTLPVAGLAGKTLRLSGWVKARDAGGGRRGWGVALSLQAKKNGAPHAYSSLLDHVVAGSHDWTRREVVLAIPSDADSVEFGVLLRGSGSAWFDDAELAILAGSQI